MVNNAININDLRVPPANRLEKLSKDREGQYSIRINDQWRICFEWKSGDAFNVEITDYH
jgi:toxin HigB-1